MISLVYARSPAWLHALQGHVAAAAVGTQLTKEPVARSEEDSALSEVPRIFSLFSRIVNLRLGEALIFSLGAAFSTSSTVNKNSTSPEIERLGAGYLVVKIRKSLTEDGGRSVMSF